MKFETGFRFKLEGGSANGKEREVEEGEGERIEVRLRRRGDDDVTRYYSITERPGGSPCCRGRDGFLHSLHLKTFKMGIGASEGDGADGESERRRRRRRRVSSADGDVVSGSGEGKREKATEEEGGKEEGSGDDFGRLDTAAAPPLLDPL